MKKFDAKKNIFGQNNSFVKLAIVFPVCFQIRILLVHIQGNQLVPELLLKLSDTLH